jgi:hypothetical protein
LTDRRRNVTESDGEGVCGGQATGRAHTQKAVHTWKRKCSRVFVRIVVEKPAHFTAKLERMFTAQVIQSIGQNIRRVGATLWKTGRTSEIKSAAGHIAHGNLRQTDRFSDPVVNSKVDWIQFGVRAESNVDAVESEPCLVDQIRSKRVRFIQRENLTMRLARVAKAGNVISL